MTGPVRVTREQLAKALHMARVQAEVVFHPGDPERAERILDAQADEVLALLAAAEPQPDPEPDPVRVALDDLWGCIDIEEIVELQRETIEVAKANHELLWHVAAALPVPIEPEPQRCICGHPIDHHSRSRGHCLQCPTCPAAVLPVPEDQR